MLLSLTPAHSFGFFGALKTIDFWRLQPSLKSGANESRDLISIQPFMPSFKDMFTFVFSSGCQLIDFKVSELTLRERVWSTIACGQKMLIINNQAKKNKKKIKKKEEEGEEKVSAP